MMMNIELPATLLAVYAIAMFGLGLTIGGLTVMHVAKSWMREVTERLNTMHGRGHDAR